MSKVKRFLQCAVSLATLAGVYIFQRVDVMSFFVAAFQMERPSPEVIFVVQRVVRLILNDAACLLLIHAVFQNRNFNVLAGALFLVELFFLLPLYLAVKLWTEGPTEISSPLLSQVHRLVVNPLLMLVLMSGFGYQQWLKRDEA
jgi:exosortase F-associated protein